MIYEKNMAPDNGNPPSQCLKSDMVCFRLSFTPSNRIKMLQCKI